MPKGIDQLAPLGFSCFGRKVFHEREQVHSDDAFFGVVVEQGLDESKIGWCQCFGDKRGNS